MTKKKINPEPDESIPTFSEESGTLGTIRINHSVVAGIVRLATQSVKGVINVGGAGVVEGLTDFFSKKESERGVSVSENDDGTYKIEVRVVIPKRKPFVGEEPNRYKKQVDSQLNPAVLLG